MKIDLSNLTLSQTKFKNTERNIKYPLEHKKTFTISGMKKQYATEVRK